jgi:hypothetical protein
MDEFGFGVVGLGGGLRRAFDGLVFDGVKLSDALRGVLAQGLNGLLGGLMPFEKGGAFVQGRVMPFAKGGAA